MKHLEFESYFKREKATLFSQFFSEKRDAHTEPTRKRVGKGEEKGFSKKKYTASLLMITKAKQEEIASFLNIPFGTLRNWNSQHSFKELVNSHRNEFVELYKKHINEKRENFCRSYDNNFEGKTDKRPVKLTWSELEDRDRYGKILNEEIQRFDAEIVSNTNKDLYNLSNQLFYASYYMKFCSELPNMDLVRKSLGDFFMNIAMSMLKGKEQLEKNEIRRIREALLISELYRD